jgi:hypothetical protein
MNHVHLAAPLLGGRPAEWYGLPADAIAALEASLGRPVEVSEEPLGYYPAERRSYRAGGDVIVLWARGDRAVMLEAPVDLPASALDGLEAPCAILPHEILADDGYAHERLYCGRGLVATVIEPFAASAAERIVRLRGIAPVDSPADFGPELYKSADDQTRWR